MDKSEMRIRSGFVLSLVVILAILAWSTAYSSIHGAKIRTKAKIVATRGEERWMADLLVERATEAGGLTNINNEFVLHSLMRTNNRLFLVSTRTNDSGKVADLWQTPFRVQLVGPTNFIIRSAGQDLKYGSADDIVLTAARTLL